MHAHKRAMLWINLLGGAAVLGSYGVWLSANPGTGDALWGSVPSTLRPLYTAGMFAAAVGYFCFGYLLLFRLDPQVLCIGRWRAFPVLNALLVGMLAPSAVWMPLTYAMLASPSTALWVVIRLVLAVVGLSSAGLVAALLSLRPRARGPAYWLGVAGAVLFTLHTLVLDALVWPAYF